MLLAILLLPHGSALGKCYLNEKWFHNKSTSHGHSLTASDFPGPLVEMQIPGLWPSSTLIRIVSTGPKTSAFLSQLSMWLVSSSKFEHPCQNPKSGASPESWSFLPLKKTIKSTEKSVWWLCRVPQISWRTVYMSCNQTHKEKAVIGKVFILPTELVE